MPNAVRTPPDVRHLRREARDREMRNLVDQGTLPMTQRCAAMTVGQRLSFSATVNPRRTLFSATVLSYVLLAVAFCAQASTQQLYAVAGVALGLSALLVLFSFKQAVLLVVLVTHLGPLVRWDTGVVGAFTIGDLFLIMCVLRWVAEFRPSRARPVSSLTRMVCMLAGLAALSCAFTPDLHIASTGIVNLAQFFLVYGLVYSEIRSPRDVARLLHMISATVLVCGTLHLYAYAHDIPMSLSLDPSNEWFGSKERLEVAHNSMLYFQKNYYFYPTFIASCCAAFALSISHLLTRPRLKVSSYAFHCSVLMVCVAEGLEQGSRTILITCVLSVAFAITMVLRAHRKVAIWRSLAAITAIPVLVSGAIALQRSALSEAQQVAFSNMLVGGADESWGDRVEMLRDFTGKLLFYPRILAVGLGPNVPLTGPQLPEVSRLMYIDALGTQVPSFHNFYADVLVQFGLGFFVIFVLMLASTVARLWRACVGGDVVMEACFCGLVAWLILWNSHATPWTKPVLIFAELLASGHVLLEIRRGAARMPVLRGADKLRSVLTAAPGARGRSL